MDVLVFFGEVSGELLAMEQLGAPEGGLGGASESGSACSSEEEEPWRACSQHDLRI